MAQSVATLPILLRYPYSVSSPRSVDSDAADVLAKCRSSTSHTSTTGHHFWYPVPITAAQSVRPSLQQAHWVPIPNLPLDYRPLSPLLGRRRAHTGTPSTTPNLGRFTLPTPSSKTSSCGPTCRCPVRAPPPRAPFPMPYMRAWLPVKCEWRTRQHSVLSSACCPSPLAFSIVFDRPFFSLAVGVSECAFRVLPGYWMPGPRPQPATPYYYPPMMYRVSESGLAWGAAPAPLPPHSAAWQRVAADPAVNNSMVGTWTLRPTSARPPPVFGDSCVPPASAGSMLGELDGNAASCGPTYDQPPAPTDRVGTVRVWEGGSSQPPRHGSRHLSPLVEVPSTLPTADDSAIVVPGAHVPLLGHQAAVLCPLPTLDEGGSLSRGSSGRSGVPRLPIEGAQSSSPSPPREPVRQSYIKTVSDQVVRSHPHKRVAVSRTGLSLYQCQHCDYVSDSYVVTAAASGF